MIELKMPLIEGQHEKGTLAQWLVENHTDVDEGQPVAIIDSESVCFDICAEISGKIAFFTSEGSLIHSGETLAFIKAGSTSTSDLSQSPPLASADCSSESVCVKSEDSETILNRFVYTPCAIPQQEANASACNWLARHPTCEPDIFSKSIMVSSALTYVPFSYMKMDYSLYLDLLVSKDVKEIQEFVLDTRIGGSHSRQYVTKTENVTRYGSLQHTLTDSNCVVINASNSNIYLELLSWDPADGKKITEASKIDAYVDSINWSKIKEVEAVLNRKINKDIDHTLKTIQRNSAVSKISYEKEITSITQLNVLSPFYITKYNYLNETYQINVDGRTGRVSGQFPANSVLKAAARKPKSSLLVWATIILLGALFSLQLVIAFFSIVNGDFTEYITIHPFTGPISGSWLLIFGVPFLLILVWTLRRESFARKERSSLLEENARLRKNDLHQCMGQFAHTEF